MAGPSKESLEREILWRKCAEDEEFFIENFWYVRHPEHGRILMKLRPAQKETLRTWRENRYSVALKARQIGFSTLAGAHAFWLVFFHSDRYVVMLSKGEREAISLLKKAKYGYRLLPNWMLERGPTNLDNNMTTMSFNNESQIASLPSGSDPARGESVYLVIVDEWAFLDNPDEAWASIEPITDIGGRVIGISTAKGTGNFFHKLYVGAKARTNQFVALFFPWSAVTERDDGWYDRKAKNMPSWQLHQEYPRDDVECFIKSGNPVFDMDILAHHRLTPAPLQGYLVGDEATSTAEFVEAPNGPLSIWKTPVADGRSYVMGVDVAEGTDSGDYSVVEVIDHQTGEQVAEWHGHVDPDTLGWDVVYFLGWFYGAALAGIEINNDGGTTAIALKRRNYPNIYYRYSYDQRTDKRSQKIGWRTQVNTKPLAINELRGALRGRPEVNEEGVQSTYHSELSIYSEACYAELTTFVYDVGGKMHGQPWDDRTMALAIANQMRKHAVKATYGNARKKAYTFDWWAATLDTPEERQVIGGGNVRAG